jgi:putative nucleotidyltransferase with HDIG domain
MYTKKINMQDAQPGMKLAESVYVENSAGVKMLAARKGAELDAGVIRVLTNRGVKTIDIVSNVAPPPEEEIPREEIPVKIEEPKPIVPQIIIQTEKPKPEKIVPVKKIVDEKLKEEAVENVKELFSCFTPDGNLNKTTAYQAVENVESVIGDLLDVISDDSTGLVHINDLKQFDEYTYHHSLSVSVLSIATGKEMGLDGGTLFRLGRCAMLHDIGKQLIPIDIINKKGKLTDEEFRTIKNHTVLGAISLKKNAIGDVELWNGMMFHHEKIDGTGYPKQLKGKDIPLFSKIIAVADVYDAITSYRSYRSPMVPSEAFEIIFKDVGIAFDYDVVKAFLAKLELYPANTIVELSNGKIGLVVPGGSTAKLRPTIRLWGGNETLALAADANKEINITRVLQPSELPEGYVL